MKSYKSYERVTKKLRKVIKRYKSYKRVIRDFKGASFFEILEKWPPYKSPKTTEDKKSTSGEVIVSAHVKSHFIEKIHHCKGPCVASFGTHPGGLG